MNARVASTRTAESSAAGPIADPGWRDARLAAWNALKLCGSFAITWTVALGVRFWLPRMLGPSGFGEYDFAEALAGTTFVLASFGLETYVQKEIPLRIEHAGDFFGGITALRVGLSVVLASVLVVVLGADHRSAAVVDAVLLFAVGQLFFNTNSTLAAFLHARGTVDGLSVGNVCCKALWGLAIAVSLVMHGGIAPLAGGFALAEMVRSVWLYRLCRRHLELRIRFDPPACARVLRACAPFFITSVSVTLFSKLDDTLLGFFASSREVGWYGLASNLAQLALIMTPLVGAILLPLFSRAQARSEAELDRVLRRSLELVLGLTIPLALALELFAPEAVRWIGGGAYAPSARALRLLAPVLVLNYVGMICADCLYLLGRAWKVTRVCLGGLCVNVGLNAVLIPMMLASGPGGGGVGAAIATIGTELFTTSLFVWLIGRRVLDARLCSTVARTVLVCAGVALAHVLLRGMGPFRLLVDTGLYVLLALAFRAVRPKEVRDFLVAARSR